MTLLLLALTACSSRSGDDEGGAADTAEVVYVDDQVYLASGQEPLLANLTLPGGDAAAPMVVLIHGGAFQSGTREDVAVWADLLARQGIATAAIDYRLACQSAECAPREGEAAFPAPIQDTKCAVRWLRSTAADWNIDPDRIAALGTSSGAWFSMMLAFTAGEASLDPVACPETDGESSAIAASVDFFGPTDWTTIGLQRRMSDEWYGPPLTDGERTLLGSDCVVGEDEDPVCAQASPVTWLAGATEPIFIAHSADDPVIPVAQSYELVSGLERMGASFDYVEVDGLGHGWSEDFDDPVVVGVRDQVVEWLIQALEPAGSEG